MQVLKLEEHMNRKFLFLRLLLEATARPTRGVPIGMEPAIGKENLPAMVQASVMAARINIALVASLVK